MENVEEKEMMAFSWTGLFAVTGFCFFLFSLFIKFINGSHFSIFVTIGCISLVLAFFCFLNNRLTHKQVKTEKNEGSTIFQKE